MWRCSKCGQPMNPHHTYDRGRLICPEPSEKKDES